MMMKHVNETGHLQDHNVPPAMNCTMTYYFPVIIFSIINFVERKILQISKELIQMDISNMKSFGVL